MWNVHHAWKYPILSTYSIIALQHPSFMVLLTSPSSWWPSSLCCWCEQGDVTFPGRLKFCANSTRSCCSCKRHVLVVRWNFFPPSLIILRKTLYNKIEKKRELSLPFCLVVVFRFKFSIWPTTQGTDYMSHVNPLISFCYFKTIFSFQKRVRLGVGDKRLIPAFFTPFQLFLFPNHFKFCVVGVVVGWAETSSV